MKYTETRKILPIDVIFNISRHLCNVIDRVEPSDLVAKIAKRNFQGD